MVRYQSETNRYDVHFQYAQIGWYEIHELIVSGKIDLCIATKFEEPEVAGTYIETILGRYRSRKPLSSVT